MGDNDNNIATTHTVNVKVARFNEKNQEEIPKEYPLQITVNENKEICIVLDAVDLEAARILDEKNRAAVAENETYEELLDSAFYQNTASILRFMGEDTSSFGIPFDTETIYVISRAGLDLSDASVKTTDTVQNPLMGKKKINSGNTTVAYDIQNARHLFNIRFSEIFYGLKDESGSTDQKRSATVRPQILAGEALTDWLAITCFMIAPGSRGNGRLIPTLCIMRITAMRKEFLFQPILYWEKTAVIRLKKLFYQEITRYSD